MKTIFHFQYSAFGVIFNNDNSVSVRAVVF